MGNRINDLEWRNQNTNLNKRELVTRAEDMSNGEETANFLFKVILSCISHPELEALFRWEQRFLVPI